MLSLKKLVRRNLKHELLNSLPNFIELHSFEPIAHHRPTLAPKVNPNLPLPQIAIPVSLPISNTDSFADCGTNPV
ncbi:hypothetical protein [Nostoc sp. LEGE 12450]|uniref:hypothetical protein n=1 Tax=Nostoc sp. LEGE 12450 TaxID=1828643 RepID=UPI001881F0B9|nr:hypothetical protein [Nostoc sp. LEGE 12450]MBE8992082.1 hypothetical protein [Nostoc sp. LEGE 12450]